MTSPQHNKRREMDVMKLLMSDWKVQLVNESTKEFEVDFSGPSESPYEGGVWKVRVELPDNYPYKSPSIGFKNRIYHPNVDESAGSVCLDVINQTWSPMFDLVNVFEVFLPQLLLYPNPSDPLNGEAAALMLREPDTYKAKIKDYVQRYAMGHVKASAAQRSSSEQTAVHAARAGTPARQSEASQPGAGPANSCAEAEASGAAEPAGSASQDQDDLLGLLSDSEDDV